MHEWSLFEVPDDDISLESHESLLSWGNVFTRFRHSDDWDLVIMSS